MITDYILNPILTQTFPLPEENEYDIRLLLDGDPEYVIREKEGKREFIASTNAKEQYIHPIAEIDKLDLLQNGWDYTLRDLVNNYNKERMQMARSSASTSSKVDNEKHHDFDDYYDVMITTNHSNLSPDINARIVMQGLRMRRKGKNTK